MSNNNDTNIAADIVEEISSFPGSVVDAIADGIADLFFGSSNDDNDDNKDD